MKVTIIEFIIRVRWHQEEISSRDNKGLKIFSRRTSLVK